MTRRINLDRGWSFRRCDDTCASTGPDLVDLPHNPFEADLDGRGHWCGVCEYTQIVHLPEVKPGERCVLFVGAAMHTARVVANGSEIGHHEGGYLPFEVELPAALFEASSVELTLQLDNRDNPDVPPGKPLEDLDFCWYGGLYRGAELRVYPAVHITEAVSAGEVGGGGILIRTLRVEPTEAWMSVQTHVRNAGARPSRASVRIEMLDGESVVGSVNTAVALDPGTATHVLQDLPIPFPRLWSPDAPCLYHARVTVVAADGMVLDQRLERFGVRRISFSRSDGFRVNGRRVRLRGTNRHQEFPRVGYAAPRAAQYRDARRIKEAGFDYVRLSHYPQSTDFLDACDELGIVVMNSIPGWQFIGGDKFRDACERNARVLIRRDRNHPSVVLWELSLNETAMDEPFMRRLHAAGHEEYPGDQMFTCGWIDHYDVFIHSRQHGCIHSWTNGDKALVVAEYGDWEFYAMNEGFDQKTGVGVLARWSNSRHFRGDGERAIRQQAWNHMIALNDTLGSPAVLDGQWAVFDYARGYDSMRAAVGVMDVFRVPKFSYWFYRSQRDPDDSGDHWSGGPVVFIATHWTAASDLRVIVFSNCDEVELRLNGAPLGRARPDRTWKTQHLPHPPFCFHLPRFVPGSLEAFAFRDSVVAATHTVTTPGEAAALGVAIEDLGIASREGESDLLFAHASIQDARGSLCVEDRREIAFAIEGDAVIVGPAIVAAEAGIASVVVRLPAGCHAFILRARDGAERSGLAASCLWGEAKRLAQSCASV